MSKALTVYDNFKTELDKKAGEIGSQLPGNIKREKFVESVSAAVRHNPELLQATPRSLFAAIVRSAQDGLLPDGKEGVITIYKTKTKSGTWETQASWNPMVWGLRKRAKELDDIIISAYVVYENDVFEEIAGFKPNIKHIPTKLGQPKGAMIGAYAVFARKTGVDDVEILHAEVMDKEAIEAVQSQSKQPAGLMWTKFITEAWKKTAVRRGIKSVPCSEKLETIAHRDDELYDFDAKTAKALDAPAAKPALPPPPVFAPPITATGGTTPYDHSAVQATFTETAEEREERVASAKAMQTEEAENPAPPPPRPAAKKTKAPPPPPAFPAAKVETVADVLDPPVDDKGVPNPKSNPDGFKTWLADYASELETEEELSMLWQDAVVIRKHMIDPDLSQELMKIVATRGEEIRKKARK